MSWPDRVRVATPAKVNLGLEVIARRPDGYHEIVSVLQSVSLFDLFEWTATRRPFNYLGFDDIAPEQDLVARALAHARDAEQWTGTLSARKGIPAAAGLGGGSSDAALALRISLPNATGEELLDRAARLGSDVSFFLSSGTALASGTGSTLAPLATPRLWFVLVTPPLAIAGKTQALYRGLDARDFTDGAVVRGIADRLGRGTGPGDIIPNAFTNRLMSFPVVRYAYDRLLLAGSSVVSISGAGPTVYAVLESYHDASRVAARLPLDVGAIRIARTIAARDQPSVSAMALAMRGPAERV